MAGLLFYGAISADDVGLGKTKQALFVGYLHTVLFDEKKAQNPTKLVYKPIFQKKIKQARHLDIENKSYLQRGEEIERERLATRDFETVERFSDVTFNSIKGYKLRSEELEDVLQKADLSRCEICFKIIEKRNTYKNDPIDLVLQISATVSNTRVLE